MKLKSKVLGLFAGLMAFSYTVNGQAFEKRESIDTVLMVNPISSSYALNVDDKAYERAPDSPKDQVMHFGSQLYFFGTPESSDKIAFFQGSSFWHQFGPQAHALIQAEINDGDDELIKIRARYYPKFDFFSVESIDANRFFVSVSSKFPYSYDSDL